MKIVRRSFQTANGPNLLYRPVCTLSPHKAIPHLHTTPNIPFAPRLLASRHITHANNLVRTKSRNPAFWMTVREIPRHSAERRRILSSSIVAGFWIYLCGHRCGRTLSRKKIRYRNVSCVLMAHPYTPLLTGTQGKVVRTRRIDAYVLRPNRGIRPGISLYF